MKFIVIALLLALPALAGDVEAPPAAPSGPPPPGRSQLADGCDLSRACNASPRWQTAFSFLSSQSSRIRGHRIDGTRLRP